MGQQQQPNANDPGPGRHSNLYLHEPPTDASDPQNNTLMISGADLQGGGGLDPNYITLANDDVEFHKHTAATSLSLGSIGVGCGGVVETMMPHAILAPEFPVAKDSALPPSPKSSGFS